MAAITRKPHTPRTAEHEREAAIQAVINRGLAPAADRTADDAENVRQVVVFVPESLLLEVDALVKTVRPRTSRRSWLVEAIREKVERDRDPTESARSQGQDMDKRG